MMRPPSIAQAALATVALAALPASAEPETLSVGQLLSATTRTNPQLAGARVDVAAADASLLAAAGVNDWLFSASLGVFLNRDQVVSGNVVGTAQVDAFFGNVGLTRQLFTGGTFSVSLSAERRDQVFGIADDSEVVGYATQARASLTQPLLRGRGEEIARANLRRAALGRDIQTMAREQVVRDVMSSVLTAYWDVTLAWRELEIRKSNLALAVERKRITNAAIEAGTVAPTEALAVEQIIATNEEDIVTAELTVAERSLDLRRSAGLEVGPDRVEIKTEAQVGANVRKRERGEVITRALAASPEITVLETRGEDATIAVRIAKNALLPRLDLDVTAGPQGTAGTVSQAVENASEFRGWQVVANLNYEQTLSNRAARGADKQARLAARQQKIDMADARRMITLAAVRAYNAANQAMRRMEISERTVALAERNIEAEQGRFRLGRSTNFDVLQRQEELKQARLRYARAVVDYNKAEIRIQALTGELLQRYGVSVGKKYPNESG